MPATAAHQPDEGGSDLAPVVPLAARRSLKKAVAGPAMTGGDVGVDTELREQASRHWAQVFAAAGVDLGARNTAAVISLVTKELERLVGGLLVIREGRGESLPANPAAGVDLTSAMEIAGVLRDLAHAADVAAKRP
jgi:hypothetical protein